MAIVTTDNKHYADIADKIREKINSEEKLKPEKIAAAVDKVYAAGQKSITDAIPTISTTVSTDRMYLRIDDISEVPHDVTIFNPMYSDATYVYGKNLLNEADFHNKDSWVATVKDNGSIDYNYYFSLPVGTYTFSAISNLDYTVYLYLYKSSDNGETWIHQGDVLSGAGAKSVNVQVGFDETLRFFVYPFKALIGDTEILKVQAEWGTAATEYEPYKRQYVETPYDDEKQMHIGVAKSMYPTMTISGYYDDMGVNVTYNKSYGKQRAYDEFWDAYQINGNRASYEYGFASGGWTDETFKPKYDLILGAGYSSTNMFWGSEITNIAKSLQEQGVKLDTTKCQYFASTFQSATTIRVPELNVIHAQEYNTKGLHMMFYNAKNLQTIDKLIVAEDVAYSTTFNGCAALENITFEGTIGKNISFYYSPKLTYTSLMSIINHLKDYNGSGTTYTLTIGATNLAKLTDAEKAKATQKGWTLA